MSIKVIEKKASDNEYFHLDFHLSMNMLLDYIIDNYGYEGVIEYITQFTKQYHKPLIDKLKRGDLLSLQQYIEKIYTKEKWAANIKYNKNELIFSIESCPGISYIKSKGQIPSKAYVETYKTLYKVLCEKTPFEYTLVKYNENDGKSTHKFTRRKKR